MFHFISFICLTHTQKKKNNTAKLKSMRKLYTCLYACVYGCVRFGLLVFGFGLWQKCWGQVCKERSGSGAEVGVWVFALLTFPMQHFSGFRQFEFCRWVIGVDFCLCWILLFNAVQFRLVSKVIEFCSIPFGMYFLVHLSVQKTQICGALIKDYIILWPAMIGFVFKTVRCYKWSFNGILY